LASTLSVSVLLFGAGLGPAVAGASTGTWQNGMQAGPAGVGCYDRGCAARNYDRRPTYGSGRRMYPRTAYPGTAYPRTAYPRTTYPRMGRAHGYRGGPAYGNYRSRTYRCQWSRCGSY